MSDTPITDDAVDIADVRMDGSREGVVEVSRRLERERNEARACLQMAMYGDLSPESPDPHAWVDSDIWARWRKAAGLEKDAP